MPNFKSTYIKYAILLKIKVNCSKYSKFTFEKVGFYRKRAKTDTAFDLAVLDTV